jgi:hypothetical protein
MIRTAPKRPVPARAAGVLLIFFSTGIVGCGGKSPASVPRKTLAASMKAVLVNRYMVSPLVDVECGNGLVHPGQVVDCTAVSSAGQGYRIKATLPCWTATFNGEIIEGSGLRPPGSPSAHTNSPTGPSNLPNKFAGCLR